MGPSQSSLLVTMEHALERPDESAELAEKRKMYVVVRGDLPPGLRAAQAGHAVAEVCLYHASTAYGWNSDPDGNYLIILEVADEKELLNAYAFIRCHGIQQQAFREPDLDNEMTAFAALPSPELNYVFAHFPLAYTKRRWAARFRRWIGLESS